MVHLFSLNHWKVPSGVLFVLSERDIKWKNIAKMYRKHLKYMTSCLSEYFGHFLILILYIFDERTFVIKAQRVMRLPYQLIKYHTGCLVMNATKVFAKARKGFPKTKTCGKSLLYIGHFDIQRPCHSKWHAPTSYFT